MKHVNTKIKMAPVHMCKDSFLQLKLYLTQAFVFMENHSWIANSYVAEFFTQSLWEKFPLSWRKCFEECTFEEIGKNILHSKKYNKNYKSVWPLSLLSFVATCHSLALNRRQHDMFSQIDPLRKEFSYTFKKHMKPKKQHELSLLPKLIHLISERNNVKNIIDVGSGLGHLARILAYRYGYNVTAVERTGARQPIAQRYDRQVEEELKRFMKTDEFNIPHGEVIHVTKEIHPGISSDEFCSLFTKQSVINDANNSSEVTEDKQNCILIGLHTCGDLASTMLRMFRHIPEIVGVVSVSCCYFRMTVEPDGVGLCDELSEKINTDDNCDCGILCQQFSIPNLYENYRRLCSSDICVNCKNKKTFDNDKLSVGCTMQQKSENKVQEYFKEEYNQLDEKLGSSDTNEYGFPLSSFLQRMSTQPMKYKSLETACHFVDDYVEKLFTGSPNLKLHCYRAVMEVFLRHINPELILTAIRCKKIKNAAAMSFEEYAGKVMERIGLPFESERLGDVNYTELLQQTKNVTVFHSLSLLMGPVIESIALIDKQVYLMEAGFDPSLIPVFDPRISPRNFVIVADKTHAKLL